MKASLRFRTESLFGDMPTNRTECISGLNSRLDTRSCSGSAAVFPSSGHKFTYGPSRAYVNNRDLHFSFEIDMDAGVYTAWRTNAYGSPAWSKPRRVEPLPRSGSTVHTDTETVDTGERKNILGYPSRRVTTRTTVRRDSELISESESDGWYTDAPAAWLNLHPPDKGNFYISNRLKGTRDSKRDDFEFSEKGTPESGFTLSVSRLHRSWFRDPAGVMTSFESSHRDEVTEISEAALDPELFLPPRAFRRVMQMPNGVRYSFKDRLRYRWEMLTDLFALRRRFAR